MRKYLLDGAAFSDRDAAYDYLIEIFDLPNYQGRNLDALWDSLSFIAGKEGMKIEITNVDKIQENLGDYARGILSVFTDLAEIEGVKVDFQE